MANIEEMKRRKQVKGLFDSLGYDKGRIGVNLSAEEQASQLESPIPEEEPKSMIDSVEMPRRKLLPVETRDNIANMFGLKPSSEFSSDSEHMKYIEEELKSRKKTVEEAEEELAVSPQKVTGPY